MNSFSASATITDGERYEINGLNIWDHQWKSTGERISVYDAVTGSKSSQSVNEIIFGNKSAKFVAHEVSNGLWKVYHEY